MIEQLQLASLNAQIAACQARVTAMEAANHARREQGKADAYGDSAFFHEAETLDYLGQQAIEIIHRM